MTKVTFTYTQQLETLCPSFEAVVEFRVKAVVFKHDIVEIESIEARACSPYHETDIWQNIPVPSGGYISEDNKRMLAIFREMARNQAYKIQKQTT